ncbi:protein of unknown function [Methanoculleus bourgensis]|uniref:Uncharacterized protein n=1 Tax=Methanoculleus bourgensis TaxID=83986 RepID=A0A0X3BQD9_9EURY|nr:protein of unknown function [Methanoculleus bourgensis]
MPVFSTIPSYLPIIPYNCGSGAFYLIVRVGAERHLTRSLDAHEITIACTFPSRSSRLRVS